MGKRRQTANRCSGRLGWRIYDDPERRQPIYAARLYPAAKRDLPLSGSDECQRSGPTDSDAAQQLRKRKCSGLTDTNYTGEPKSHTDAGRRKADANAANPQHTCSGKNAWVRKLTRNFDRFENVGDDRVGCRAIEFGLRP